MKYRTDRAFVEGLQAGDQEIWTAFVESYSPLIKNMIRWQWWRFRREQVDDITHLVHIKLAKDIGALRDHERLMGYIRKVVFHCCVNEIRRVVKEPRFVVPVEIDDEGDVCAPPELITQRTALDEIIRTETCAHVRELLLTLDETCRKALHDIYINDTKFKNYAAEMGLSINTICARVSKCLNKIRTKIRISPTWTDKDHEY